MIGTLLVLLIAFKLAGFPIEITWGWLITLACIFWIIRSMIVVITLVLTWMKD